MRPVSLLLALSHSLSLIAAASLQVHVQPSTVLPNPNVLSSSTHATLTSGNGLVSRAVLRKSNYFEFDDIATTGSHLLNIYSQSHVFAPYRIDISESHQITLAAETYHGIQWSDHGINLAPTATDSLSINAKCVSQKDFYAAREGFNIMGLLKNPMILMGGVALLFTFGMPKLMENMDPEMKAEYDQMQKKSPVGAVGRAMQGQPSGAESFDLAGFLAGRTATTGSSAGSGEGIRERKR